MMRTIQFYKSLEFSDLFFIKRHTEREAEEFIKKSRHLDEFKESGYVHLEIERAFSLDEEETSDEFLEFIKKFGRHIIDKRELEAAWLNDNGWYAFEEINKEKWLKEFYSYKAKLRQEAFASEK